MHHIYPRQHAALLKQIALEYDTPTYVYFESILKKQMGALLGLFPDLPVRWLYAIKANDNPHLMQRILNKGFGFDTVSFEEVRLAERLEQDHRRIFYTENNMTDGEMNQAIESGVVLNLGSLSRLKKYCAHPNATGCCIRIKPDIGDGHHEHVDTGHSDSKFGIQIDMLPEARRVAKAAGVKIFGIHMHIGSGINEPMNLLDAMKKLLSVSRDFPDLTMINFGGGIPIPYKREDKEFNLPEFKRLVAPLLAEDLKSRPKSFSYWFEPGRWIVGSCGMLLTRVTTMKQQGQTQYIGTDTGFNHLIRPAMYGSWHEIENISAHSEEKHLYTVSGNICESGDILAKNRMIRLTQEGDLLGILDSGAYGMTMASHYNRRRLPAEVLVNEKGDVQAIRIRKSVDESISDFLDECLFTE